jgi:hypothetical protein
VGRVVAGRRAVVVAFFAGGRRAAGAVRLTERRDVGELVRARAVVVDFLDVAVFAVFPAFDDLPVFADLAAGADVVERRARVDEPGAAERAERPPVPADAARREGRTVAVTGGGPCPRAW